jgi:hypothetical protein
MIAKGISTIHAASTIEGDNLFQLPMRVYGEESVGFGHVSFPHSEV